MHIMSLLKIVEAEYLAMKREKYGISSFGECSCGKIMYGASQNRFTQCKNCRQKMIKKLRESTKKAWEKRRIRAKRDAA